MKYCETCEWWDKWWDRPKNPCKRYPPKGNDKEVNYPWTTRIDGCGEHKQRISN